MLLIKLIIKELINIKSKDKEEEEEWKKAKFIYEHSSILCLQCINLLRTSFSKVLNIQRKTKENEKLILPRYARLLDWLIDPLKVSPTFFLYVQRK